MKKLLQWLKYVVVWLTEPRVAWVTLIAIGVSVAFVTRPEVTEPQIRITGLVLQLLGIGTVAWGLRETRKLFGRPSLYGLFREWLHRFPMLGGRVHSMSANVRLGGVTANGRGHVSASAGANPTVKARIEALEKNVVFLSDRIAQTQNEMDKKFRDQAERLKEERVAWQRDHEQLSKRLEATETGGLHVSAAGVLLLFVGVAMSTASPEIQRWIS
ncbi:MAG: hypothetical protein R3E69_00930 [Steroidobacteraceae bacterium]